MDKKVTDPLGIYKYLSSEGRGILTLEDNKFTGSCDFDLPFINYDTHWRGNYCSFIETKFIENKFNYPTIKLMFDENYSEESEYNYDDYWDHINDCPRYSIDEQIRMEERYSTGNYNQYVEGVGLLYLIDENSLIGITDISLGNSIVGSIMVGNNYSIVGRIEKDVFTNVKKIHFDLIQNEEYLIQVLDFLNEDEKIKEELGYSGILLFNNLKDRQRNEIEESLVKKSSLDYEDEDLPF